MANQSSLSPNVTRAVRDANVETIGPSQRRNKFHVVPVRNGDDIAILKVARNNQKPKGRVREDLAIEVAWDNYARKPLAQSRFRIPRVISHDPKFRWALFEYLEGRPAQESDLPLMLGEVARLCARISEIPLDREPNGLSPWWHKRMEEKLPTDTRFLDSTLLDQLRALAADLNEIPDLIPGTVHGDLKLENLIVSSESNVGHGILDGEFATVPAAASENFRYHTELDKPRYQDAAYFYHLLCCQSHDPALAETFLQLFQEELIKADTYEAESFDREIHWSALERTVSMGSHFVWDRDSHKVIDDPRRTEPEPYIDLIRSSLAIVR